MTPEDKRYFLDIGTREIKISDLTDTMFPKDHAHLMTHGGTTRSFLSQSLPNTQITMAKIREYQNQIQKEMEVEDLKLMINGHHIWGHSNNLVFSGAGSFKKTRNVYFRGKALKVSQVDKGMEVFVQGFDKVSANAVHCGVGDLDTGIYTVTDKKGNKFELKATLVSTDKGTKVEFTDGDNVIRVYKAGYNVVEVKPKLEKKPDLAKMVIMYNDGSNYTVSGLEQHSIRSGAVWYISSVSESAKGMTGTVRKEFTLDTKGIDHVFLKRPNHKDLTYYFGADGKFESLLTDM